MKVAIAVLGVLALLGASGLGGTAPFSASQVREEFAAVGQMPSIAGSQMVGSGATANITISIESYSSDDEVRLMVDAFARGQHKALRKALEKAAIKGRIAFAGRNGYYELKLLRSKPTASGRQIYGIGERSIRFLDGYYPGRSHLEEFGFLRLDLTSHNGLEEGSGLLIHKANIKSLTVEAVTPDDHGIEPVRLTVRRQ